jgi:3-oxoacyl-[acyl-carrier protein] reductase
MLKDKTAVIYGGGAVGGSVAKAFVDAGARVHLAGRSRDRLDAVAARIGDVASVAEVDALDEGAVTEHADAVAADAGGIDVALNAVSTLFVNTKPLAELTVDEAMHPIDAFLRTNLITAKATGRHMAAQGSGTILTLSTAASTFSRIGNLGFGTACAAVEAMTARLAIELGPSGVRAVCLRPTAIEDAPADGSYTREQFAALAEAAGGSVEQMLAQWGRDQTVLGRLPVLAQVADAAVFLASDQASAITGTVVDLTCGKAVRTQAGGLVGLLH